MFKKIGFVGVGRMGANMARRLKDRKFNISVVYDNRPEAAQALAAELKTEAVGTLARVTELSDIVFTVVSDDRAMMKIFAVQGDSLLTNANGRFFINCATISPEVQLEVEHRAQAVGAFTLEACMASSIPQAREGTLFLMCAGD